MLPARLSGPLKQHLYRVRQLHESDLAQGYGSVHLPSALARKYPNAAREWIWQYAFPAARRAHHFPFSVSSRICLSKVKSATSFFSRPFSISSSLSRLASSAFIPPY